MKRLITRIVLVAALLATLLLAGAQMAGATCSTSGVNGRTVTVC
jgi:hypothetical protein